MLVSFLLFFLQERGAEGRERTRQRRQRGAHAQWWADGGGWHAKRPAAASVAAKTAADAGVGGGGAAATPRADGPSGPVRAAAVDDGASASGGRPTRLVDAVAIIRRRCDVRHARRVAWGRAPHTAPGGRVHHTPTHWQTHAAGGPPGAWMGETGAAGDGEADAKRGGKAGGAPRPSLPPPASRGTTAPPPTSPSAVPSPPLLQCRRRRLG